MPRVQRLAEDPTTSNEVRWLLDTCAVDGPSESDLARFSARMAPLVGLPAGELVASPPAGAAPLEVSSATSGSGLLAGQAGLAKTASSALSAKLMVAGAAVLVAGGLWWGAARRVAEPSSQPAEARSAVQVAGPASMGAPEAAPVPEAQAVAPESASMQQVTEQATQVQRRPSAKLAASAEVPDELSLMADAQQKRGKPAQLLRVLAKHERLYPNGMLAQEREVLAVEAWIESGNLMQARKRAAALEAKFPNSAHLPRIRRLLEQAAQE